MGSSVALLNEIWLKIRFINRTDIKKPESMSLKLDPKGGAAKAILYEYSNDDLSAFLSALNAYRYFKS